MDKFLLYISMCGHVIQLSYITNMYVHVQMLHDTGHYDLKKFSLFLLNLILSRSYV